MKRLLFLVILCLMLGLVLPSCESLNSLSISKSETTSQPTVLDFAEPAAINILNSIDNGDFGSFIKDFNEHLKSTYTQNAFLQLKNQLTTRLGLFRFIKFQQITTEGDLIVVFYVCDYQKGSVSLKLSLEPISPFLLAGFSFPDLH
jgi:hypothetical protein